MSREELELLRPVSASMGIMLETASDRLAQGRAALGVARQAAGGTARDDPARRESRVPFTSGILIGIGETRAERIEALLALRRPDRHGHLQEVIVQNFRRQAGHADGRSPRSPSLDEHLWTIAVARILLGADWHVQAPPNLVTTTFPRLLDAGIDDWGGVSPVTIDHVNPEAPWPELERLAEATRSRGLELAAAASGLQGVRGRGVARSGRASARPPCRGRDGARTRGRLGAGPAARAAVRRPRATLRRSSSPETSWARTSSSASSRPAGGNASVCSPRPTGCGGTSAATR